MPSIIRLADAYNVSRSTMQRCIKELQAKALVHVNPRGAIFSGPQECAQSNVHSAGRLVWDRLTRKIGEDVLSGLFGSSVLPPANKLALHYRVSMITLKKALNQLKLEGLLVGHGRTISSARSGVLRQRSRLMLIASGRAGGPITITDGRIRSVAESFERTCQRLGFESRSAGYDDRKPTHLLEIGRALAAVPDCAGYVVSLWNPFEEIYRSRWNEMLAYVCKKGVPVIVLDMSGNLVLEKSVAACVNLRMLRIAGVRAGEIVADMLLRIGHKQVAYLSPSLTVHWARDRYNGLCRYMQSYGGQRTRVELFVHAEGTDSTDLTIEFLGLNREQLKTLLQERYSPEGLAGMLDRFDRIEKRSLLGDLSKDLGAATVRAEALHQVELLRKPHDRATMEKLYEALFDRASTYAQEKLLDSFFRGVVGTSKSTAWVVSNDKIAISAYYYLARNRQKSAKVPALVGFDNSQYALITDLSSFDFNIEGMVTQAVSLIIDQKSFKSQPIISEVDGFVVERGTTRR